MTPPTRSSRLWLIGLLLVVLATCGALTWWVTHRPKRIDVAERPPALVPAQPAAPAETPREAAVWAVVVGIDQYRDARIAPCHGAAGDARAVGRWLSETAGWGRSHVLVLDDAGAPDLTTYERTTAASLLPTRDNLSRAVTGWLSAKPVRAGDVVVFYFAGQAALAATAGDAPAGAVESAFLLPIDARASAVAESGWSPDDLISAASAAGEGPDRPVQVVCWLDTSLAGRGETWSGTPKEKIAPASSAWLARLARWPGVTAWLAADGVPSAEAARSNLRSPFTTTLLKGLGTPVRPGNLLACLDVLRRDPTLATQGFRTQGGVGPDFGLWPSWVRRVVETRPELLLQRGHAGPVEAIAVTPDGARAITAGADSTVRVWRLADRKLTAVLSSHLIGVTALALRGDGRLLVSGDGNGRVRFWDLSHRVETPSLPVHAARVETIGFLPGSDRLVSLDLDGKVVVWSVRENELGYFEVARPVPGASAASGLVTSSRDGPLAFALAEPGGPIRVHDAEGNTTATLEGPGGIVTSARLATDGQMLVAGDDAGRVKVWNLDTDMGAKAQVVATTGGVLDRVAVGPGAKLALATSRSLQVGVIDAKGPGPTLRRIELKEPVTRLEFSPDGRWLAAGSAQGAPRVWQVDQPGIDPVEIALFAPKEKQGYGSLAFLPDGRSLIAGDQSGGFAGWSLPGGGPLFGEVRGRRGRIVGLSVSADHRYLLQIGREGDALVWDLTGGRSLKRIDGQWVAGVITPDGSRVVLTSRRGDLTLCDRETGKVLQVAFDRPKDVGPQYRFGPVAVDGEGRLVAAGSVQHGPGGPVACVWELATGRHVRTIVGHEAPQALTSVDFAPDSRRLLTASEDGTAQVWELKPGEPSKPAAVFRVSTSADDPPIAVTSARFDPSDPRLVVTGSVDGQVLVWATGRDRPLLKAGTLDRAVAAVTVTPDGRWLAAGGGDKEIHLWGVTRERDERQTDGVPALAAGPIRLQAVPHHDEQVNALLAWPAGATDAERKVPPILASGSDDTTIRLWRLSDRSLLGTLSADLDAAPTGSASSPRATWVVYTPDGLFDSAIDGERQVTWLRRGELQPLEQSFDVAHVFALADRLRRGDRPAAPVFPADPPPRVALDRPAAVVSDRDETPITVSVGSPGAEHLRLYQNGVPILGEDELAPPQGLDRKTVTVRLTRGVNRFYAMASRPGALDGRSNEVEVLYNRPEEPNRRMHVLSLGVGRYVPEARSLRFAGVDAKSVSDFLHRNTPLRGSAAGEQITLIDNEVSEQKVVEAFLKIRDKDLRPDDTIVVFLAGHTGTQRSRYYLLLPGYPFPVGEQPEAELRDVKSRSALAYSAVYENLGRLRCLNRMVIVDACQAESVLDDPTVTRLGRLVDDAAHRSRTAYILAARRGEAASEASILKHGLLTYTLLKGLGETGLEPIPGATRLNEPATADDDGDGLVTASELALYTDQTLPRLASSLPDLVQRTGVGLRLPSGSQHPRIQATDLTFPLIRLPKK